MPKIVTSPVGCALRKHVLKSAGTVHGEISNGSQSVALNMPISLSFKYGGLPSGIPSVWIAFSRL